MIATPAGRPEVTVIGAGMAGMTAALKLLEAGFSVKVIEASPGIGGKFGAVSAKGGMHDFAWHVFGDWSRNLWDIVRRIGLSREGDFAPRSRMTLLRPLDSTSVWRHPSTIESIGSPETFWSNANSGIAHWSDVVLFAYSQYALLCDADIDREEFLNRVTVNGYMRSLPYMSDVAALLHDELLLRIWAIPSYLISARSYRTYLSLLAPFRTLGASLAVMKQNFEDGFWRPFLETLHRHPGFTLVRNARLTGIRLTASRDRVSEILVRYDGEQSARPEPVQSLIVAIPPGPLLEVLHAPDSLALRQELPGLLDLSKLTVQHTAALTLCFNRRLEIPGVDDEPVSLVDELESIYATEDLAPRNGLASEYGISFMDVARLRGADHPTVLTVLASDVDSLRFLDDEEACQRVLAELRRYVRFDDRDVDWSHSHYQAHPGEPLVVNAVGSWEYRPEVRVANSAREILHGQPWRTIHNLYLAGDYCRSQIDIISLEGAIHTGIWAAHALSRHRRAGGTEGVSEVPEPIRPADPDLDEARKIRGDVERWADLAARRSRLVKEDLQLAAVERRVHRGKPSASPVRGGAGIASPNERSGGQTMSAALSAYPTFASPSATGGDHEWLKDYVNLSKPVTLKSGAISSLPFLFWETQAVCIQGLADAESLDLLLRDQGLRARHVKEDNPNAEEPGSGQASVRIWAVNHGGTSVGPIRTVHALVHVQPRRECKQNEKIDRYGIGRHMPRNKKSDRSGSEDKPADHWWWWWYYGDSIVNQEFKRDVLGVPNELAMIEMTYLRPTKIIRLLENGGTALRITCPIDPKSKRSGASPEAVRLRTVARRSHDDGENWVSVYRGPSVSGTIPAGDETILYLRKDSTVQRQLRQAGFRPLSWSFYEECHGAIEIWDDKGSGKDPVRDTDDKFEVVRQGEGWLIREYETP